MAGCLNIKILLLMKENQISQAMEFSTFLCMERYKSLGLVKSFLTYASQLSWASILCFFHILSFLGAHPREWLVWQSNGYQIAGILLLLECPEGSGAHIGRLQSLMTVTSLFADKAGSSPFLNPFWEILVIWSVVDGECEDSACPWRSLKRITVGP